ncbi:type VI secretion system Vgr family protein [Sphingomonas sp.]|uniref:type VI secretion system Vgr family protein n=1 Tax=Sphingomonas sp. TaxID=28214 RepID=UPI0035BC15BB
MATRIGTYTQDNRIGRLTTELGKDELLIVGLTASERLSESYTVTIDAFSEQPQPLHKLLGTAIGVAFTSGTDMMVNRDFAGVLWEYNELGRDDRGHNYRLVLRPALDFLTLNRRNRIFQNKSAVDIVKSLLAVPYQAKLDGTYDPLEYCVQYQESDFDFISRMMEYEGIYYHYEHSGDSSKLVLVDSSNAHDDLAPASVKVMSEASRRPDAPIWSVTERRALGPAKVTVADYDFEAPSTEFLKSKAAAKILGEPTKRGGQTAEGSAPAWGAAAEVYDFPGKIIYKTNDPAAKNKQSATASRYSALWLDAHRRRMARSFAEGALFSAAVGRRLTLNYEDGTSTEYLIVGTAHDYSAPSYDSGEGEETFGCTLELMPATEQYRPAMVTPRPRILGPQTALVVGPAGEEIYTDKYGRIKVQFPWDREGKKDEKASCFIRVVQAAAGQAWGSFSLPRIGQEVVVTFLDGDPDRPLVTGAVYNGNNPTPATLPDNKTQFGLHTRITKGGGGHNRWWFEDKKGSEVVWFRAERDYDAHVLHGNETRLYTDGNRTTDFKTGNDTKTLDKGNLTTLIKKGDETRTIELGKRTTTINGDDTLEIKMGNRATTIKMGNDTLKVAMGNIDTKADLGKISMEAMQSIELKVGGSSILIDQVGITIKGTVKVDIKGIMVNSSADAIHIVLGGIVMIN